MDVLGLISDKPFSQRIQSAFDGFSMSLESRFAPTRVPVGIAHFDEEPARTHPEVFNTLNLRHSGDQKQSVMVPVGWREAAGRNASGGDKLKDAVAHERMSDLITRVGQGS